MSSNKVAKIFAHDAGAANATFAYVLKLKNQGYKIKVYPKGPAIKIFQTNLPDMIDDNQPQFHKKDLVITGLSGIHSKYELEIIKKAREKGVQEIISIMDVPYNLDQRFIINGKFVSDEYLPNEIWIPKILKLSANKNINKLLVEKENPYWEYIKEECYLHLPGIKNPWVEKYKNTYILYLTQYIQEQYGDTLGYTEFTLLEDFLDAAKRISFTKPIFIKLHPQEREDKYNLIIRKFSGLKIIQMESNLPELLYYSKAVFGNMSSVFYESVLINKPSYSLQIGAKRINNCLPKSVRVIVAADEVRKILKGAGG